MYTKVRELTAAGTNALESTTGLDIDGDGDVGVTGSKRAAVRKHWKAVKVRTQSGEVVTSRWRKDVNSVSKRLLLAMKLNHTLVRPQIGVTNRHGHHPPCSISLPGAFSLRQLLLTTLWPLCTVRGHPLPWLRRLHACPDVHDTSE